MRARIKSVLAIILAFVCVFSVSACEKGKSGLGYNIKQGNMFAMCAVPDIGWGSVDSGVTSEMIGDFAGALNVKSMRVWMHLTYVLELDKKTGEPKLKTNAVARFREYIDTLKANGVEDILIMSHYYLYPVGFRASSWSVIPEPDTDEYIEFMELLEKCFALLSATFPDVHSFEPSNETNSGGGHYIARPGFVHGATGSEAYTYSDSELALITADICYYANRGIKSTNPNNQLVLPGMVFSPTSTAGFFLGEVYEHIESGKLPTSFDYDGNRKIPADTNTDNYFNVLNWHPYVGSWKGHTEEWLNANRLIYDEAIKHGDKGKKVFISEFGYTDSFDLDHQEQIATYIINATEALLDAVPYIESIFYFRMFNWISTGEDIKDMEKTFGLFTSPQEEGGVVPKPAVLALNRYFNGEDADTTVLYKYQKTV